MHLLGFNTPISYLLLSFFFLLFSSSTAYNITEILNKYPDFSIFNDYLTRTQVCNDINEHRVMTVLVVNNAGMSSLVGKSMDVITKVIRMHVFLDYFTLNKFHSLPSSQTTQVTTLFASPDQQRYLNITNGATVTIFSAAGSDKAEVVRDIAPDDIYQTSIVQISNLIVPSSLSGSPSTTTPSISAPSPPPTPSPSTPSPSVPSSPSSSTFNITKILNNYPDFSQFNTYLTDTQVCNQINEHSTITVLVVNNAAMSSLTGKSIDIKKKVLSLHVIMDYYTSQSFHNLPTSKTTQLTTLLQASFQSIGHQGLLNATNGDTVSIVSAVGSDKVEVVKDIYTENLKISVVQITSLIVPSDSTSPSSSVPSPSVPSPSPPPSAPSSSSTFNITEILNKYPDFSIFNDYLTRTQVCNQINERKMLTILVANNEAMSSLVGKPMDVIRKVLSNQVVLDYYNVQKFHALPVSQSTRIITLLEVTEKPNGQQGFVNVTNGDTIAIVSAAGSDQSLVVRDLVADERSFISVVQINKLMVPSGITSPSSSPSPSVPSPSPSPSVPSPSTSPSAPSPSTSPSAPSPSPSPSAPSPSPSPSAPSPSPSSPTPSPSSSAYDITKILNSNPDFNLFNNYLTQTQVANQINERKTMTILVANNGAMSSLVDKSMEIKKKVLSLHVIMDYYTIPKFHNLPVSQSTRINTLLEITDQPSGQQGFVNVTNGDRITIVSAAGSDQAVVVRDVASDDHNTISVVQISNIILPPGFTSPTPSPSSNTGKSRAAAPVKAPSTSIAAAPKLGGASSSSAPKSDSPISSLLAPGPAGFAHGSIAGAPLASATPARFSINYASVIATILVSVWSLTSMMLI